METPGVLLVGNVPFLNLEDTEYPVHTIAEPTSQQYDNWQATIRRMNPLLVMQVISNQSESEAISDIQKALDIDSRPVIGLHLLGVEGPDLVLTESCNINQLDNAIVCDFTIHNLNEIVHRAIDSLIPPLATQRLSSLSEEQSLMDRLLQKPDPRPLLKKLAAPSVGTEPQVPRQIELTSMGRKVEVRLLETTESTIYIEVESSGERMDAGTTVQITDRNTREDTFILGRVGSQYALAQTVSPISLRYGMRMPYTATVTIARGGERTALGYDLSQSGMSIQEPPGLLLFVGMEILLTTQLKAKLRDFDINFELNRELGYVARFFEKDGQRFVGVEFRTPKPELADLIEGARRFPQQLEALMDDKQREYEQRLAAQETRRQVLKKRESKVSEAICMGEALIDLVSTVEDASLDLSPAFSKAPGGLPANLAVGLSKLGVHSAFIGKVGDDPFGAFIRRTLDGHHVDISHLISGADCRTTLAFVGTGSDGQEEVTFYRNPGADMLLAPDEIDPGYIQSARLFHYSSVSLSHQPSRDATLKAIRCAGEAGALMAYDPNPRLTLWDNPDDAKHWIWEVMPYANVVRVSEEAWEFITGTSKLDEGSERILESGVDVVVVTRAENGCYYNNGSNQGEVEGFQVDAVDPAGAGDGFVAGMLAQMLNRLENARELLSLDDDQLRAILRYANAAGALTTQQIGVIPALPTASEVEAFLSET